MGATALDCKPPLSEGSDREDLAKEIGRPSVYSQSHSACLMRAAPYFALPIRRVKSPQAGFTCEPASRSKPVWR